MNMIKVKLTRSVIGTREAHRRIVRSLGLGKLQSTKELPDCPEVRGQIAKIQYLVTIVE